LDRPQRPLFRRGKGRVDEGFTQINFPAVAEIFREALQEVIQPTTALPLLKAAMARLIRWVAWRQVMPRRARAEYPEHAVQDRAGIAERTSAAIGATPRAKTRREQVHWASVKSMLLRYDAHRTNVSRRVSYL
jgi:hypothetical protein